MEWERPTVTQEKKGMGGLQAVSVLFLVLTVLVLLCYLTIFINPQIPFNPFKPAALVLPTPTGAIGMVTATPTTVPTSTRQPFPPTWTPTATPIPTMTPTWTPTLPPTWTPAPTSTPKPLPPISLRSNLIFTSQQLYSTQNPGTWWSGVAGEVTNRAGEPVTDAIIRIWDDRGRVWETQSGNASKYGETYGSVYGGRGTHAWWEQFLDVSCKTSVKVNVQARIGNVQSQVVTFNTSGDCAKNLVLVHFQKNY